MSQYQGPQDPQQPQGQPPQGQPPGAQPYPPQQPGQQYAPLRPPPGQGYPPQQPGHPPQAFFSQQPPVPAARPWYKKKRFVIPGALLALILLVNLGSGGSRSTTVAGSVVTVTQPAVTMTVTQAAAEPTKPAEPTKSADEPTKAPTQEPTRPAPTKEATKAPAKKKLTSAQENAIGSAQDYLSFTAFSKKGLIHQLSSDAGEGYSKKDATFAVESLDVDWKEQAYKSAKSYLELTHFSQQGLIEQLESDAGEGFTHDQAVYGAKKALR